jgi:hypothetical protein
MVSAAKVEQWCHLAKKKSTFSICFNLPSWLLWSSLTTRELHAIKQATWYMTCAPSPCLCLDYLFDQSSWFQTPLAIAFQSLQTKSRPPNTSNWLSDQSPWFHTPLTIAFHLYIHKCLIAEMTSSNQQSAKVGNIPWSSQKYKVTIHSNCWKFLKLWDQMKAILFIVSLPLQAESVKLMPSHGHVKVKTHLSWK